jgi:hypothetical protein
MVRGPVTIIIVLLHGRGIAVGERDEGTVPFLHGRKFEGGALPFLHGVRFERGGRAPFS